MTSARPPKAAAGKPPPMTLPKVIRSGRTPSMPYQPALLTRKPVITSSEMYSAPFSAHSVLETLVEAGQRRHHAHVAGRRLGDHAGDLARVRGERGPHRVEVVVRQHDRVAGLRAGHPRGVGQPEGRHARTGRGQQRVHMPVVAAGELDHLGAAGEAARQPDRRHRRLGAGGDQPHLLDRLDPGHDLLGELDLALAGRAEGRAAGDRLLDGGDHLGVRVAEDHRPPRAHEVDVLAAVGVGEVRTGTGHHEPGRTAHGAEGPHRRVHAAGRHSGRAVEERLRNWGFIRKRHCDPDLHKRREGGGARTRPG